jgi:solute carrier family 25 citrate transporter 1
VQGRASGFVAGLGAGAAEAVLVTTPQETLKIKLIDDQFKSEIPRYKNTMHGISTIVREEGIRAVYQGLCPTVFKVATAQVGNKPTVQIQLSRSVMKYSIDK